jgi:polyhydroxybutyrate depolymerase
MSRLFIFYPVFLLTLVSLLSACVRPNQKTGKDIDFALDVDGRTRTWILRVPPSAENNEPLPLLVVLHGTYGTGSKMQRALGFDPYADQRGFYVAYPDAYQKTGGQDTARWNDGRGTLESSLQEIDDVLFITEMIAEIGRNVVLDASRVYVTGASNGGMMTYRLGCETANVFAGIAPVIANIPEPIFDACTPQATLAFLSINGSLDPFIPLDGGEVCENVRFGCEGGWVVSQAQSAGKFVESNACQPDPLVTLLPVLEQDGTSVEQQTFPNCQHGAQVKAYIVQGGGHNWPPLPSQLQASGPRTKNLDATRIIVDFFFP